MAKEATRNFSVKTKALSIEVSGESGPVTQTYQALQGLINSLAPTTLTSGDDFAFTVEEADEKADGVSEPA